MLNNVPPLTARVYLSTAERKCHPRHYVWKLGWKEQNSFTIITQNASKVRGWQPEKQMNARPSSLGKSQICRDRRKTWHGPFRRPQSSFSLHSAFCDVGVRNGLQPHPGGQWSDLAGTDPFHLSPSLEKTYVYIVSFFNPEHIPEYSLRWHHNWSQFSVPLSPTPTPWICFSRQDGTFIFSVYVSWCVKSIPLLARTSCKGEAPSQINCHPPPFWCRVVPLPVPARGILTLL